MMKKLFLLMTFLCAACPSALRAQQSTWWGYWNTSMPLQSTTASSSGTTVCAIRLTTANTQLIDGTLHGLRFWLADKSVVSRAYVWVSVRQFSVQGDLQSSVPDMAMKELSLDELKDLSHDGVPTVALFDEAVAILPSTNRYASAYVGYTIETTSATPLMAAGADTRIGANTCFVGWKDQESTRGPLAMQLLVSGPNIASVGMAVEPLGETIAMAGQTLSLPCRFTTAGATVVESIDCQVTLDGVAQPSQRIAFSAPLDELGLTVEHPLQIAVPAAAKAYDCQVAVTQVNGQTPVVGGFPADATFPLIALSQRPVKRTVMEELTGTWCPNCPRGLVGIQLLEEQFGDRFVGIAIHGGSSNEPMRVAAYDGSAFVRGVSSRMGGRPSCSFDRVADGDPYWGIGYGPSFGADLVVGYLLEEPCVADLALTAHWSEQQPSVIDCDVSTTFRYSSASDPNYALTLVLTADSLTGDGSDWLQVNGLSGRTDLDADLDIFTQGPRRMAMKFNHVAIAVAGVENGLEGSVTAPFTDGEAQHFLYAFDTAGNTLLQSCDYLHAVAMLIDTRSGQVVNVARCNVASSAPDTQAVANPDAARRSPESSPLFDLSGRKIVNGTTSKRKLKHGLYLQRNGKKQLY